MGQVNSRQGGRARADQLCLSAAAGSLLVDVRVGFAQDVGHDVFGARIELFAAALPDRFADL
jgi:hypothetical protein